MRRHAQLIKLGLNTSPVFATRLINDYSRSSVLNSVSHAHQLFEEVPNKDTVLWTSLIAAYTHSNYPYNALQLFSVMLRQPESTHKPNHFVFATVARAIASFPEQIFLGQCIHAQVIKSGFLPGNIILETSFVDMYAKCHVVEYARKVFDEMPCRNLITWNAMVSGYVQNYMEVHGLNLFCRMKCEEIFVPDEFSVATALTGCACIQDLVTGMQVHGYVIVSGLESKCNNSIGNMYFCCGEVCSAERVLSGIECDTISKLIKIRGYAFNKRYFDALKYIALEGSIAEILKKDNSIVVPILHACANLSLTTVGKQVHTFIVTSGRARSDCHLSEDNAIIASTLIDMYCKGHCVNEASKIFKNWYHTREISPWNSIISGYIYNGYIEDARMLMESIPQKNVISWTTMISGYILIGRPQEGLALLNKMYSVEEKIRVNGNCMTFVVGLEACSHLTDFDRGKQIHAKIVRTLNYADTSNVIVGTALVDMYSKSGYMHYAQVVFDMMLEKNVVAWTSIIMGYAVNGLGLRGLEAFKQMISTGVQPNEVTFVSVLTACSHCGLVDEGLYNFKLMREKYKLVAREDHYTCLIDMLGRVGRLEDAWKLLKDIDDNNIGSFSVGTVWAALLGACHLHGNVELGSIVGKKLLENRKQGSTTSKTLSNVYAAAQMWNEAHDIRRSWRNEVDAALEPGLSRIYANARVMRWIGYLKNRNANCFSCFPSFEKKSCKRMKSESSRTLMSADAPPHRGMSSQPRHESPKKALTGVKHKEAASRNSSVDVTNDKANFEGVGDKIFGAHTFTFRELAAATKNFRQECLLGEGGFGRVYKGKLGKSGQVVAIKQLDRNGLQGNEEFLVEVLMLSLLHDPNLVNLIGYCADGDQRLLVYEYMSLGSLEDHLLDLSEGQQPLDWYTRMKIALHAAKGLEYLHEKANPPVIYRDLKSSNILLDHDFNAKLSDFGLAKLGPMGDDSHVSSRVMGTYGYCAPEYQRTGQLTAKSDVYSFGVVLLELITGKRAIDMRRNIEQTLVSWAEPIFKEPRRFTELADPLFEGKFPIKALNQAVAVASMCLQDDATIRPLMSDVVTALTFLGDGRESTGLASPQPEIIMLDTAKSSSCKIDPSQREIEIAEAMEWANSRK